MKKGQTLIGYILLFALFASIFMMLLHTPKKKKTYYQNQKTVAQVIACEACSENKIGMYLVANTIRNRAIKYNITPYKVVIQPNQYYGLNHPNKEVLYLQCKEFAEELARNIMDYPDLTDGALYFRQPNETKQTWHNIETIRYLNHIFYK